MAVKTVFVCEPLHLISSKRCDQTNEQCKETFNALKRHLDDVWRAIHCIELSQAIQFPELRLIEYDCGKNILKTT